MQISVNVTFQGNPELLTQLVEAFFIKEFNPESSLLYDGTGRVRMLINFDGSPPSEIMSIVSKGDIDELGYNTEVNDEWIESMLGKSEMEHVIAHFESHGKLAAGSKQNDDNVPAVPDGKKDIPGEETKSTQEGKESEIPARFLESADALNLPERSREAYLKMLVTAINIDGRISWETIEAAGYTVPHTDQKAIAKAIREVYDFSRTMSFVRKLVAEEKEGASKGETASSNGDEPEKGSADNNAPTPPDGDEPKKVFPFTCVRTGEKEFDTTSLCEYEERLNSIDKQISLHDRVKEVFETLKVGNAEQKISRGSSSGAECVFTAIDEAVWNEDIKLVVTAMQLPIIDWKAPIWEKQYGRHVLMRKRIVILRLFKEMFEKLHVPYEGVTLENILCDLRNMIMTEDEISALAE